MALQSYIPAATYGQCENNYGSLPIATELHPLYGKCENYYGSLPISTGTMVTLWDNMLLQSLYGVAWEHPRFTTDDFSRHGCDSM